MLHKIQIGLKQLPPIECFVSYLRSQHAQAKGFSPVCDFICMLSSPLIVNRLLQTAH